MIHNMTLKYWSFCFFWQFTYKCGGSDRCLLAPSSPSPPLSHPVFLLLSLLLLLLLCLHLHLLSPVLPPSILLSLSLSLFLSPAIVSENSLCCQLALCNFTFWEFFPLSFLLGAFPRGVLLLPTCGTQGMPGHLTHVSELPPSQTSRGRHRGAEPEGTGVLREQPIPGHSWSSWTPIPRTAGGIFKNFQETKCLKSLKKKVPFLNHNCLGKQWRATVLKLRLGSTSVTNILWHKKIQCFYLFVFLIGSNSCKISESDWKNGSIE